MLAIVSYIYLALPLGIFFISWLRAPYAIILVGALIVAGILLYKDLKLRTFAFPTITFRHFLLLSLVLVWIYFSGAGEFSFQNGDWIKHNAILSDLTSSEWPIRYDLVGQENTFLNYYLGWYMVPATVGKIYQNLHMAFIAQYVWTTFGVLLSFAWLSNIIKKPHWSLYVFFILFATADSLGIILLRNTNLLNFITPLEHWSTHEYSSFTTLLFWVPGQAIGIWIVMGVLFSMYKNNRLQSFPIWIALLMFWSPFGVIGLMPFITYMVYRAYKQGDVQDKLFVYHTFSAGLLMMFFYLYFDANIFRQLHGNEFSGLWLAHSSTEWGRFGVFLLSESILPLSLIFVLRSYLDKHLRSFFYIALPVLLFLPLYKYGLLNDLVMRASIPALFIVFLCSYTLLSSKKVRAQHRFLWLALIIYFILGTITPITEINRSVQSEPNIGTSYKLLDIGDEMAIKQYLGREHSYIGKYVFR